MKEIAEKAEKMRRIIDVSERLADAEKNDKIAMLADEISVESDEVLAKLYDILNEQ